MAEERAMMSPVAVGDGITDDTAALQAAHGGKSAAERALMARFDAGHRIALRNGYWLQKSDDNRWQVGKGEMMLGFSLESNVLVGKGGSFDGEAEEFAAAMTGY